MHASGLQAASTCKRWWIVHEPELSLDGSDNPHGVAAARIRRNVSRGNITPTAFGIEVEVVAHDLAMAGPIAHVRNPHCNGLRGKATVAEGHYGDAAWLQHPVHLCEYLPGLGEIVYTDNVSDEVELAIAKGQGWVGIEISGLVFGGLLVRRQLPLNHSSDCDTLCAEIGGVVADPRTAYIQRTVVALWCLGKLACVKVPDRADGTIVDMRHKAGLIVEIAVVAVVLSPKVAVLVRPSRRPLRVLEDLTHAAVCDRPRHLQTLALPADHLQSSLRRLSESLEFDVESKRFARKGWVRVKNGSTVRFNCSHNSRYPLASTPEHYTRALLQARWHLTSFHRDDQLVVARSVCFCRRQRHLLGITDAHTPDCLIKAWNDLPCSDRHAEWLSTLS
mmetsp:Transcript_41827/g.115269  ORF Transcript_41827/g.115269 Transcript_41827/m.115269 type:complete len:391 (+) Transcript_41827:41-1213(+)